VCITGGRCGSAGVGAAGCGVLGSEGIGRTSVRTGAAGGFGGDGCVDAGDNAVGVTGGGVGFAPCDICSGSCVFASGVSDLRSIGAAFGVTITEGGLKLDGIGSGRPGMKTGADSFSAGGLGGGATGADALE
jgi:hypothetical protein